MRRHGVRRLAFSSTSAIYGICERQPIAEDQAPHPISLYGATKLSCEAMIGAFQHLFDMDCWIFRFANVVGPKVRKRGRTVIGDFIDKLRQDPTRLQNAGQWPAGQVLPAGRGVRGSHALRRGAARPADCTSSISAATIR